MRSLVAELWNTPSLKCKSHLPLHGGKTLLTDGPARRCRPPLRKFSSQASRMSQAAPSLSLCSTIATAAAPPPSAAESFLSGEAQNYIDQMYSCWVQNPSSVHASWDAYFRNVERGLSQDHAFALPPNDPQSPLYNTTPDPRARGPSQSIVRMSRPDVDGGTRAASIQPGFDVPRILRMVRAYQARGHEFAKTDPLGLPRQYPFISQARERSRKVPIDYRSWGFTEGDLDRTFDVRTPAMFGFLDPSRPPVTLRQLLRRLEETYCGPMSIEYMHIDNEDVCNWLRDRLETPDAEAFSVDMKIRILTRTARAHLFEKFCASKFNTAKRFGSDGCETLVVLLKGLTKMAARIGVNSVIMGMPHRGRLNVLTNVMHKPMQQMMCEFQGVTGFGGTEWGNTGDVKYHLGVEFDHYDADSRKQIHMVVLANPSHLEAVDPLVLGQARAQQYYSGDATRTQVLPVLIHGDASISGQGVVYETVQMAALPGYTAGGAVHVVVNNQIGFTTNPGDSCSGKYCTDVAKTIDAPVLHVNADDPEAVTKAAHLALEYRQKFHGDIFIDLIGYRRFGHNELDMPKFTQPLMYNLVSTHPSVLEKYAEKLITDGVVTKERVDELKASTMQYYAQKYEESKSFAPTSRTIYLPQWAHMAPPDEICPPRKTGVELARLKELGMHISTIPSGFTAHPGIQKIYRTRADAISSGENVDFGLAEALAFASLLSDGFHIRLAGQDVQRGTFSHRHAVIHDQLNNQSYCPLASLKAPRSIEIVNSLLSENGALGYEIGYSQEHPDTLSLWEAQFGDFANGAQVMFDQFIASGEVKWGNQCGIVVMLPHGYDGQGPEHSSARVERLLQLCDDREDVIHPESWDVTRRSVIQKHNIQVVNCSTPANFFHVLRRQLIRGFRKPLIAITPKRMLKMRATFSKLEELASGRAFVRYIPDVKDPTTAVIPHAERPYEKDNSIVRLILCSGQLYYDLAEHRAQQAANNVAIARVEQLSPFPFDRVVDDIARYPKLESIVWAQEEPMNAGGWFYTSKRIASCLTKLDHAVKMPLYAGRDVHAATAAGDARIHQQELHKVLEDSFNLKRRHNSYYERYLPENFSS